jgi:hypothetical protein
MKRILTAVIHSLGAAVSARASAASQPHASPSAGDLRARYAQFEALDPFLEVDVGQTICVSPSPQPPVPPG